MKWLRIAQLVGIATIATLALTDAGHGQAPAQFDLPDGVGKDQVMASCTTCHAISIVTAQRKSQEQWADTVEQMAARGAQVSEEDYPVIVKYLGANFAPAATASAAAVDPKSAATKTP